MRKVRDSVVVITGASSGIGRATALALAREGAAVVLAARRQAALEELAAICTRMGGHALAHPADVTDPLAVEALARHAVETFGRVDGWVNNAAVSMFGRFEESPLETFRRVVDTNLFGCVHGAHAVLPYFREQGSGVLINMSSVFGDMPAPYQSAYVTTKYAVRGFSDCLRQELRDADIHVCTVMPASIDTPMFQHAANYTGRAVKPLGPVVDPDRVAQVIMRLLEHPRREVVVGQSGRLAHALHRMVPALVDRVNARQVEQHHFLDAPAPPTPGNLVQPSTQLPEASGGWKPARPARTRFFAVGALLGVASLVAVKFSRPRRPTTSFRRLIPTFE